MCAGGGGETREIVVDLDETFIAEQEKGLTGQSKTGTSFPPNSTRKCALVRPVAPSSGVDHVMALRRQVGNATRCFFVCREISLAYVLGWQIIEAFKLEGLVLDAASRDQVEAYVQEFRSAPKQQQELSRVVEHISGSSDRE